jgi:DNA polymerase-3 subunit gamma/tau
MSYLVSARRWRPQTFEDLVGQEHIARTLSNALRSGKVAHAFLFTGLRGVGKTTAARILAKALNCEKGPTPTPCNQCVNCEEITASRSVDVIEIDGASNTGVDDVRQIIENVRYQAAKSRNKVYIIDEVHMLSNSAFNALLKTLEEPPPHVKFIFATTDPHKLPATVQSRCQRYDFRRIPLPAVVARLRQIIASEGVEANDRALFMLAREGEGSMRDAQSLLDQVLAYGSQQIDTADVVAALGVADRTVIHEIVDAIIARDGARALAAIDVVYQHGQDLRRLSRDLLEHTRNLAVAKVTNGELLPELADEERAAILQQAQRMSVDDCDRAFRILQEADEEAARSQYPKLVVEMAVIRLATMPPLLPLEDVLGRLEEMEGRARKGSPATPVRADPPLRTVGAPPRSAEPPVAVPIAAAASPAAPPPQGDGSGDWSGFIAFVAKERGTLAHYLEKCQVAALEQNKLELRAPKGFYYDYLARADHVAQLTDFASRFFARGMAVRVQSDATTNGLKPVVANPAPAETMAKMTEAALVNPAVRTAVDILGGEVQEVRQRRPRAREEK